MAHYTQATRHGWTDAQACAKLMHATGTAVSKNSSGQSMVWWDQQLDDPEYEIDPFKPGWVWQLWIWMGQPAHPAWQVLCSDAQKLDAEYGKVGISRDTTISLRAAVDALNDHIDETGWTPSEN